MQRECENCERTVSIDYFRVFNIEGVLYSCFRTDCEGKTGDHRPLSMRPKGSLQRSVGTPPPIAPMDVHASPT